ncbi:hypothetical protein [Cellulomonas aerilata]|uniref:hypothetical protein n=1 Tax=Cellulomonas aerilata TaxID=515326 RepID=UPI0031D5E1AD
MTQARRRATGPWAARLVVLVTLLASLGVVGLPVAPPARADAFDPGAIISDGVFYDSTSMTVDDVATFLRVKNPTCRSGFTCLKDYTETTWTRPADAQCSTYAGGGTESAAQIITKVARACGVSPRSLLVLLQKETSLVTRTDPTFENAYRKATGYGCPDTAPCDAQYYGFFNQVYKAAWQFQRYRLTAGTRAYQAGRANFIQYHPNAACGGSWVTIRNQATAGLYLYTPYQPNAAAINGQSDGCSAFGNLNFHRLFTQWFGSTSFPVTGLIASWYSWPGNASSVGEAITAQYEVAGGVAQNFQRGTVFMSSLGVWASVNAIDASYRASGGPAGPLGWPTGPETSGDGGWRQQFQRGAIYYSNATGGFPSVNAIHSTYLANGGPGGALGYPLGPEIAAAGAWSQRFQGGRVFYSPYGAWVVPPRIDAIHQATGASTGQLGIPVGPATAMAGGGLQQPFTRGTAYSSDTTGGYASVNAIGATYTATGGPGGYLGHPTGPEVAVAGGWSQSFQRGTVLYSPATGMGIVVNAISDVYRASGGPAGPLGFPTGPETAVAGGWRQTFQRGALYYSAATGGHASVNAIHDTYLANGATTALGFPTGPETAHPGGIWAQRFQRARIYYSVYGAWVVPTRIDTAHQNAGGPTGPLGPPTGPATTLPNGAQQQPFTGGTITATTTGTTITRPTTSATTTPTDQAPAQTQQTAPAPTPEPTPAPAPGPTPSPNPVPSPSPTPSPSATPTPAPTTGAPDAPATDEPTQEGSTATGRGAESAGAEGDGAEGQRAEGQRADGPAPNGTTTDDAVAP